MPPLTDREPYPDVVVVGAGSAGCVIAEKLSRDPGRSVLVLEHGRLDPPTAAARELSHLAVDADSDRAERFAEDCGLQVVRGRGLGGSSAVNGGYFLRWHPMDFDGWPVGWDLATIDAAYTGLDGPDGTMQAHTPTDEVGDVVAAFEAYWSARMPSRSVGGRWPVVGVNRVPCNGHDGRRRTAADAYLSPAMSRPNLDVRQAHVTNLLSRGRRVVGVRTSFGDVPAGEVILSAGTLGTAGILLATDLLGLTPDGRLEVGEHRERLVGFTGVAPSRSGAPILPSVVHTDDGLEIRCYDGRFADHIVDAPAAGAVGVAAMRPAGTGTVHLRDSRVHVRLDPLPDSVATGLATTVDELRIMLADVSFADLLDQRSVSVDPVLRTSQHAWGSMPMGTRTDALGAVLGVEGLRIVDGSILPTAGRSGPHATVMMTAARIGDVLAD